MTNKDRNILEHILMRCSRINDFVGQFEGSYDAFISNAMFYDSVSMNIFQIGELSRHLSNEFKNSTKQTIPWKQIYDMRCHFAHGYDTMNDKLIWYTAVNDVPVLKRFCEEQLSI